MATALYAMAINFDVTTEGGLAHLDNYLLTRSFISGHQPSTDDLTVFAAFEFPPRANLVNLARWYTHIKGIVDSSFPGVSVGVVFEQIQTVHFEDDAVREEAPPPARRANEEAAGRASAPETARRASEETARKTSADTGRDRNISENGNQQNGDDSLHLLADETDHVDEAMASGVQASEGRVSGKSSILLDVKPWDDETDMEALEAAVRAVQLPGLHWGASKLEPVAFKIRKLQIMLTIEDDIVSPDTIIEEHLTAEPANQHIQSCDIVAWNKI